MATTAARVRTPALHVARGAFASDDVVFEHVVAVAREIDQQHCAAQDCPLPDIEPRKILRQQDLHGERDWQKKQNRPTKHVQFFTHGILLHEVPRSARDLIPWSIPSSMMKCAGSQNSVLRTLPPIGLPWCERMMSRVVFSSMDSRTNEPHRSSTR